MEKKDFLEKFQTEFMETRKKYEEAMTKLEKEIEKTSDLIKEREASYTEYLQESARKYGNTQVVVGFCAIFVVEMAKMLLMLLFL